MGYFPRGGIRNVSSVNSELRSNDLFSILARMRGEERLKHNCWKFSQVLKHTHTQDHPERVEWRLATRCIYWDHNHSNNPVMSPFAPWVHHWFRTVESEMMAQKFDLFCDEFHLFFQWMKINWLQF